MPPIANRGKGGKGDGGRGGRGGGRGPYTPSTEAVQAIQTIFGALEALNVQDRGHVLSRVRSYVSPAPTSKAIARKEVLPKPKMSDWKSQWQATDEFVNWDAIFKLRGAHARFAKTGKPEDQPSVALPEDDGALEKSLREIAFAKRDEIKASLKSNDKGAGGEDGVSPPPDKDQAGKQKSAKPDGSVRKRQRQENPWNSEGSILKAIESAKKRNEPERWPLYAWMADNGSLLVYHAEKPPESSKVLEPHVYFEEIVADTNGNFYSPDGDAITSCTKAGFPEKDSLDITVVEMRPEI